DNWSPPPRNSLKLNVDAHCLGEGHWGLGLILRMEDGSCVGAMTKVVQGFDEAVEVETMGLLAAIEWIKTLRQQTIVIETDNRTIVQTLQHGRYPRNYWGV
ncbi:ribonuclease H protein, partial [Trifolium medium]|nr:ribonuclease H protein [Trifolium medium]